MESLDYLLFLLRNTRVELHFIFRGPGVGEKESKETKVIERKISRPIIMRLMILGLKEKTTCPGLIRRSIPRAPRPSTYTEILDLLSLAVCLSGIISLVDDEVFRSIVMFTRQV